MARMMKPGAYAPMPLLRKGNGTTDRVLPGGMPPTPNRAQNVWSSANKREHSDGTSKVCRAECFYSNKGWE